jgi:hypothetical protein
MDRPNSSCNGFHRHIPFSVVISDFNVVGITRLEPETDTPLIVYGY